MKFKFEKRYILRGLIAFLVIAGGILLWYLVFHADSFNGHLNTLYNILVPIIYGFFIAYILTPVLNFIEKKWICNLFYKVFKANPNKHHKKIRAISIILTSVVFIFIIYIIIHMLISQLVPSLIEIINNYDTYTNNLYRWVNKVFDNNPVIAKTIRENIAVYSVKLEKWMTDDLLPQATKILKTVSLSVISFLKVLWNFLLGFIISIYLMASKEVLAAQAKKLTYAFLKTNVANKVIAELRHVNTTFIGFIVGKVIDSTIIGILCFIGTTILKTPYAPLISIIVGVTNVIPFFGPYLGAIPSALLILIVDFAHPLNCLYFVIFIVLLQQLDGNLIGPMILGDSTGLSGFWIIFAITFFGGLWGVFGMFVGVPVFAVIYSAISRLITRKLNLKGLSNDTEKYLNVGMISESNEYIPYMDEEGNIVSGVIDEPNKKIAEKKKKKDLQKSIRQARKRFKDFNKKKHHPSE